ncbi:hypothetical protein Nepgr_000565 [Nepenthes gracilis]|uniref:Expansin-like EG45 domain-containing protein n=1 Tax=Nepenthes gracilis TaxID=150966 RepID=A0AAD3P3B1_NEPGR|nr:hypothetical protein Nepgr_000565 [Nepenthes gracilis]
MNGAISGNHSGEAWGGVCGDGCGISLDGAMNKSVVEGNARGWTTTVGEATNGGGFASKRGTVPKDCTCNHNWNCRADLLFTPAYTAPFDSSNKKTTNCSGCTPVELPVDLLIDQHPPSQPADLSTDCWGFQPLWFSPSAAWVGTTQCQSMWGGVGYGACFQTRCKNKALYSKIGTKAVLTALTPTSSTDLVLSSRTFRAMANDGMDQNLLKLGIVDIEYKRVSCEYKGKYRAVRMEESSKKPNYLAIKVIFQGGQTKIVPVEEKDEKHSQGQFHRPSRRRRKKDGNLLDDAKPGALQVTNKFYRWDELLKGLEVERKGTERNLVRQGLGLLRKQPESASPSSTRGIQQRRSEKSPRDEERETVRV